MKEGVRGEKMEAQCFTGEDVEGQGVTGEGFLVLGWGYFSAFPFKLKKIFYLFKESKN